MDRYLKVIALAGTMAMLGACQQDSSATGAGCPATLESVRGCLERLAHVSSPRVTTPTGETPSVALYVDRSGSMSGFLDMSFGPEFGVGSGRASMREMLSRVGGLTSQIRVFGFGDRVVPVTGSSNQDVLAKLVQQRFYSDHDTRLEDVLDLVDRDTGFATAHVIVTDGRRGGGAAALAQYKRIGESARKWTATQGEAARGTFALLALEAPFVQVRPDRAGCSAEPATVMRCPLYVFVFTPTAGSGELLDALRRTPGYLFVTPATADPVDAPTVERPAGSGVGDLHVIAAQAGRPLMLLYGAPSGGGTGSVVSVSVGLFVDLGASLARFVADDSLEARVESAALMQNGSVTWTRVTKPTTAWVKAGVPNRDSTSLRISVPIALRTRAQMTPTAYRVELWASGQPGWLDRFDAPQQNDAQRTYGLASLFTYLKSRPTPLTTVFAAVY